MKEKTVETKMDLFMKDLFGYVVVIWTYFVLFDEIDISKFTLQVWICAVLICLFCVIMYLPKTKNILTLHPWIDIFLNILLIYGLVFVLCITIIEVDAQKGSWGFRELGFITTFTPLLYVFERTLESTNFLRLFIWEKKGMIETLVLAIVALGFIFTLFDWFEISENRSGWMTIILFAFYWTLLMCFFFLFISQLILFTLELLSKKA